MQLWLSIYRRDREDSLVMDMVKALAGSQAQSIVPPALECSICQELMFHPYSIGCGHTFCGSCLKHWFTSRQQSETEKTCPTCRGSVKYPPVLVHAIRELTNNVLDAIRASHPDKADELREHAAPDPGPDPFQDLYFMAPINDRDDSVLRCQYCMWEVRDGYCEGCGRPQGGAEHFGSESESEALSEILSMDDIGSDDRAFINDGEIEYEEEESDVDAISNIRSRVVEISDEEDSPDEHPQSHQRFRPNPAVVSLIDSDNDSIEIDEDEDDMDDSDNSGTGEDEDEDSDIGQERMPIVLSDSSDPMSSYDDSD